ncbi:PadR family transcriptional regulator, partial [Nocardiopsis protaetiae]
GSRARRGDVRTGILMLLAEEPRSGYEIIREGRERSGGAWRPSPGSIYPMLQQLEDEGLIVQQEGEGRRRPYKLTEEGIDHLEEHGADLTPPWEAAADAYADDRSRYEEIGSLAAQLGAAAFQVAQAGTPEQVDRAKRLLAESKRGLYRILAEDEPEGDGLDDTADTGDRD